MKITSVAIESQDGDTELITDVAGELITTESDLHIPRTEGVRVIPLDAIKNLEVNTRRS